MEWLEPLAVAFGTIALAELADKTQLVTISQACRYSYAPVLAGSALALICVSALGVLGGAALLLVLPREWLAIIAGAMFIAFGAVMLYRLRRGGRAGEGAGTGEGDGRGARAAAMASAASVETVECPPGQEGAAAATAAPSMSSWRVFGSTFGLVALAELGDKTQLSVIALTGEYANPWAVLIGASVGFVLVCTVGVLGGRLLARRLGSGRLELVAAALFIVLGAVFLAGALLAL
jgi:putative Ca2+/H+ antiporter (TMEM165/GDT1 family)